MADDRIEEGRYIGELAQRALENLPPKYVKIDKGQVVFLEGVYTISLECISDPEVLVGWIYQLTEKIWITTKIINEFIFIVCNEKGWSYHKLA